MRLRELRASVFPEPFKTDAPLLRVLCVSAVSVSFLNDKAERIFETPCRENIHFVDNSSIAP